MISAVLKFLGVDLQKQTEKIRSEAGQFRDETVEKLTARIEYTSLTIGVAIVGGLLAAATLAVGLAGLFVWLDIRYGPMAALAGVGATTAFAAIIMFSIALARGNRKPALLPSALPAVAVMSTPPRPPPTPAAPPSSALMALVPPPPANASILDLLTHHVTTRAAAASDDAVETATEIIRTGSRSALFGTLAATVLLGLLVGRRWSTRRTE
jgi:hypothetical protein